MGRLTKRSNKTSHENGVCCTHFMSKECVQFGGECAWGCKWEEAAWGKLAEYEDAEEQGLLLRLPCKVGDAIYEIGYDYKGRKYINEIEMVIISANYGDLDWDKNEHKIRSAYVVGNLKGTNIGVDVDFCDFGRTVFLTKEEAEQALARMKEV